MVEKCFYDEPLGKEIIGLIITHKIKIFTPFLHQKLVLLLLLLLSLSTRLLTTTRLFPYTLLLFINLLMLNTMLFSLNSYLMSHSTYHLMDFFSWYPFFLTILSHSSYSFPMLRSATGATGIRSGWFIFSPIHFFFIFIRVSLYQGVLKRESCMVLGEWGSLICKIWGKESTSYGKKFLPLLPTILMSHPSGPFLLSA